jgi:hypothetical protein
MLALRDLWLVAVMIEERQNTGLWASIDDRD